MAISDYLKIAISDYFLSPRHPHIITIYLCLLSLGVTIQSWEYSRKGRIPPILTGGLGLRLPEQGHMSPKIEKINLMKARLLFSAVVISLLLWVPSVMAQGMEQDNPIYKEMSEQGRLKTGQVTEVYGVPCVEVMLNSGETIMSFVHSIPSLKRISLKAQDRIALVNGTHYLLVMNGNGNISTDKTKIFVPLDYSIEPHILPQYLSDAAKHEKFILINRRLQYIGLYEKGNLTHIFPISSGTSKATPLRNFVVNHMDEQHYSTKYDSPMDHALNIGGDYYIHEGIVPGYAASHGCVRLFPLDARFLFYHWAKVGIPGKITD